MDDLGTDERVADPWAPGGAMSSGWEPRSTPSFVGDEDRHASPRMPRPARSARRGRVKFGVSIGVTVAAVLVAIVAVIVIQRDDAPDDRSLPTSSLPSAVEPGDTAATRGDTGAPDRATNVPPATISVRSESDDGGAAAGAPGAIGAVVVASRAPASSVVEIAPELADVAPTEIVALTFTGEIVEVSIPSGRVRTTAVGFPTERAQLVTTDFGALVWPMPGGAYELVTVDGERLFVDGAPPVLATATPGLDRFFVWTERSRPDGSAGVRVDTVTADGDRPAGQPDLADRLDSYRTLLVAPDGGLLANDTGGTYVIDESGTQRLTDGDVVASGRHHVLLRECDEQRVCTLAALDSNGFRTLFPTDLPEGASPLRIGGLSPTGDALLLVGGRVGSVDTPPELQVLELIDGTRRTLHSADNFPAVAAWANDGSGVFVADVVLRFVDRVSGAAVVVSDDLPKVHEVATRQPTAPPTCELLALALPVFEDMRTADGAPVAPPPIEILEATVRVAPDDIARAAQPMVDFVGSFVSFEQPESQRVQNWPSEVRAGLKALELFADAECGSAQT